MMHCWSNRILRWKLKFSSLRHLVLFTDINEQNNYISGVESSWRIMYTLLKSVIFAEVAAECPRDAVLYELTGWDACMTWRLPSGRVLLQNFVIAK